MAKKKLKNMVTQGHCSTRTLSYRFTYKKQYCMWFQKMVANEFLDPECKFFSMMKHGLY